MESKDWRIGDGDLLHWKGGGGGGMEREYAKERRGRKGQNGRITLEMKGRKRKEWNGNDVGCCDTRWSMTRGDRRWWRIYNAYLYIVIRDGNRKIRESTVNIVFIIVFRRWFSSFFSILSPTSSFVSFRNKNNNTLIRACGTYFVHRNTRETSF